MSQVALTLIPQWIEDYLTPTAIVYTLSGTFSYQQGLVGVTATAGLELALGSRQSWAAYAYTGLAVRVGRGAKSAISADLSVGLFFNGQDSSDYAGFAWDLYVPVAALPSKFREAADKYMNARLDQWAEFLKTKMASFDRLFGKAAPYVAAAAPFIARKIVNNFSSLSLDLYWWNEQGLTYGFSANWSPLNWGDTTHDRVAFGFVHDWQIAPRGQVVDF